MKRYLKTLALLFFCGVSLADGLQPLVVEGPSKGLIDHVSPLLRPNEGAASIVNLWLDDRGILNKRGGYAKNNTTNLGTNPITGGGYHIASTGSNFFAVVAGTNAYTTGNAFGGTYTNVTGALSITAGTPTAPNLAQSTSFNNFRVFCNDANAPFKVPTSGAATVMAGAPSSAKSCAVYGNYLIVANTIETGTSFPTRIRWSDVNTTETWPANNFIDVETNDGDMIVAVYAFADSVYIFKKHSIHRMLITGLPGADAFIVRPVARGIGCTAKMSIQAVNNPTAYSSSMLIFQGQDGVYSATPWYGGLYFKKISDPIQNEFFKINAAQLSASVAAAYPRRNQYWLAITTTGLTSNQEILVYDYLQDAWTTYSGMTANMLALAEDTGNNQILLSGDNSGNVYKQDTGTSDNPLGVATAITATYVTNDIDLQQPGLTKQYKYLYVFATESSQTTLAVSAAYDFASSYEFTQNLSLGNVGALWGSAIWGTDIWPGLSYVTQRIELNRHARQCRLQFVNSSSTGQFGLMGWALVYSNEDWRDSND